MSSSAEKSTQMANAIRALSMDAVQRANSGHPGLPMGAADIATVLFTKVMKFDPTDPQWPDRDRFVLSAGHGSMLLYSVLHLLGYDDFPIETLKNFRQVGSFAAGHPEYGHGEGIETTTGPLGQGIANAVGMALAERLLNARFGDALVDHHTYCIAGDGCLMEGISHEAIALAGHLKLNRLIVLFDDNGITIDGAVSLSETGDQRARFEAFGWETDEVDGHDQAAILAALEKAKTSDRPVMIACKTKIGFGSPNRAGTAKAHGAPLGDDEIAETRKALGWDHEPFEIPSDIRDPWRIAGLRSRPARKDWEERLGAADPELRGSFERMMRGDLPLDLEATVLAYKKQLSAEKPAVATRKSSEMALEQLTPVVSEMIGGSADLTGSNNTRTKIMDTPVSADNFAARYIHYGIREHGMAAAMNGMALHGGLIPYSGTFLVFSDYCRPSLRLAAMMGIRAIHVMTHDSIGLGEDGPTHQPVEHLAALRAIPNLNVMRPADAVEAVECWHQALLSTKTPTVLALTRQGLPTLRDEHTDENRSAKGAYEIRSCKGKAKVSIFATGSEVSIAVKAKEALDKAGIPTRVVSVPSFELFGAQSDNYRKGVIGDAPVRVAVEAGISMGWEKLIGSGGVFVGMNGFGASGPYKELYQKFGITAANIAEKAKAAVAASENADASAGG